jgi:hypothetical protein
LIFNHLPKISLFFQVLNAQKANFSAVIIYNYEDALIPMGPHGRGKKKTHRYISYLIFYFITLDIQIPSTLITLSDGLSIISNYLYNTTTTKSTPQ